MKSKKILAVILLIVVMSFSGCALIQAPFKMAGSALNLVGKIVGIANKLPKPPPWVFL